LREPLARLDGRRDELAKEWLVQLVERSSLDQIGHLPTERLAVELPALISDVLGAAGSMRPFTMPPDVRKRAERLVELRASREPSAADLVRDIGTIQRVILDALGQEAEELGGRRFAEIAASVADAVGAIGAAAVESLVDRRARELQTLATCDPLTGLSNLRYVKQQIGYALGLHKRYAHPFALLLLDVDGLKRINDVGGRDSGDKILVQAALAMRRTIRKVDTAARVGGDEFCVLTPAQDTASAHVLAGRLIDAVRDETTSAVGTGVGVAVGVVSCPEHGDTPDGLLEAADVAMFEAKASGEPVALGDPTTDRPIRIGQTQPR